MSLFYAGFASDMQPLLIDANDEAHATQIGTQIAEGEPPSRVVPIPTGIFAAGLFTQPDDEDGDEIAVDPFEHVVDYLEKVDAAIAGEPTCTSEGEADGGEIVRCELEPDHDGEHEATTRAGEVARWA